MLRGRHHRRGRQAPWWWLALLPLVLLAACGGGGGGSDPQPEPSPAPQATVSGPSTDAEAARFLTQATFGPTESSIQQVRQLGYTAWLNQQLSLQPLRAHTAYWDARTAVLQQSSSTARAGVNDLTHSFWQQALTGPDQLRQRVAFALSEIFVVSGASGCGADQSRGLASYLDMLAANAFVNYRTLLEQVARHPIMGCYLSHLKNQRENNATGRVPDENFAREVMQLFAIGLYQLNADGSLRTDAQGKPLDTYTATDISGLAKVFTGFSFDCPDWPADSCFYSGKANGKQYDDLWSRPMMGYPQFHSYESPKTFLGVTVPAQTRPDPEASLKTALDTLALNHPNVGPFIGKQLIQRLVTSNPSPAYVGRVSAAFETSGRNMGAMIRAILLDPEARNMAALQSSTFGKVREPVLRLSAFLRAMGARSDSDDFMIDATDDPATALAQSPLKAPSVFNFFRPGYVLPGGASAQAGLVAPELQIAHESSAAAYVNYMRDVIRYGAGRNGLKWTASRRDVQLSYALDASSPWLTLAAAADAGPLIDRINTTLMYGTLPSALKAEIKAAVESIPFKAPASPTAAEINNRLWSALLLTVASPEFQIQQ